MRSVLGKNGVLFRFIPLGSGYSAYFRLATGAASPLTGMYDREWEPVEAGTRKPIRVAIWRDAKSCAICCRGPASRVVLPFSPYFGIFAFLRFFLCAGPIFKPPGATFFTSGLTAVKILSVSNAAAIWKSLSSTNLTFDRRAMRPENEGRFVSKYATSLKKTCPKERHQFIFSKRATTRPTAFQPILSRIGSEKRP